MCIPQAIKLGTGFSGLGCFELAAQRVAEVLGHVTEVMFSCDANKDCQMVLLENHRPRVFYPDVAMRAHDQAAAVDWYGAGFPCQPFSNAGLGMGIDDARSRGLLVAHSLEYVRCSQPSLVIYENVTGILQKKHRPLLLWLLRVLQDLGYQTWVRVLNTKNYGIPHNRARVYIVAIKSRALKRAFVWPTEFDPAPDLDVFLTGPGLLPRNPCHLAGQ